jgi:hypothetical protein
MLIMSPRETTIVGERVNADDGNDDTMMTRSSEGKDEGNEDEVGSQGACSGQENMDGNVGRYHLDDLSSGQHPWTQSGKGTTQSEE